MLDHDELLPAEQAYPGLVQELRTTYQMKPEEKQVLTRVHERLAQSSHPLPLLEPAQAETGPLVFVPLVSAHSRPTRFRQRWLPRLNMLAAVLFIGLLVGSLVFTFSIINHSRVGGPVGLTNAIHVLLVPAQKGHVPSQTEMEATRTILSQRLISFGLPESNVSVQTVNGLPTILVELPHFGGNEQQTITTLLGTGVLAFWGTDYNSTLATGTSFNPTPFAKDNPGNKPRFTNQDLDPNSLSVVQDPFTGLLEINCMMKGDAVNRFQHYTASNIGHTLTITLDGKVIASAIINSAISGPFIIPTGFTQQQNSAIVSVLKYGPLPVELKKLA